MGGIGANNQATTGFFRQMAADRFFGLSSRLRCRLELKGHAAGLGLRQGWGHRGADTPGSWADAPGAGFAL